MKTSEASAVCSPDAPSGAADRSRLWIVVHGFGRGRSSSLIELLHHHLATRRNPLLYRLRVHRTGDGVPPIEAGDTVFFWLGDPLAALYPDCYRDALQIEAAARAAGAQVLNPPDALSRTSKLRQSALWSDAGVPCARGWGFESFGELSAALPSLPSPLVVRYDCGHSQQHMILGHSAAAIEAGAANLRFPATVLEFVDVRDSFRARDPESVYSRLYHKKRAFVFCDTVVNLHVFFSSVPVVSLATCTFTEQARWRGRLARKLGFGRARLEETIREDKRFFDSPAEAPETLFGAVRTLGLDVAAIDYASTADGGVVLWEANPYFFLPHGSMSVLAAERDAVRRVDATFDALAAALERAMNRHAGALADGRALALSG